ncbi:MAG: hypothetical protein ACMUEL_08560 [Flavobacteriales bacterium Tduv]
MFRLLGVENKNNPDLCSEGLHKLRFSELYMERSNRRVSFSKG